MTKLTNKEKEVAKRMLNGYLTGKGDKDMYGNLTRYMGSWWAVVEWVYKGGSKRWSVVLYDATGIYSGKVFDITIDPKDPLAAIFEFFDRAHELGVNYR